MPTFATCSAQILVRHLHLAAGLLILVVSACTADPTGSTESPEPVSESRPPPQPLPFDSTRDDGQWLMPAKDYASTRFSTLDEITPANAGHLKSPAPSTGVSQATSAMVATSMQAIVLWAWHIPAVYQLTLESDLVHSAQHLSFLLSALLFWWAIIHSRAGQKGFGVSLVCVFVTMVHTGGLGALLTLSQTVWYPIYSERTGPWGLTPLDDEQLAGLIIWAPCGAVYVAAGLVLMYRWLKAAESGSTQARNANPTSGIAV
jgi:cytochrome c oxidase assembly factor CtaG